MFGYVKWLIFSPQNWPIFTPQLTIPFIINITGDGSCEGFGNLFAAEGKKY